MVSSAITFCTLVSLAISSTIYIKPGDDIQSSIDKLDSDNGGSLIFNQGTYIIDESLMVYSNIRLEGNSNGSRPLIQLKQSDLKFNDPLITSKENSKVSNLEIINLEIQGNIQPSEQKYPPCCHTNPSNCSSNPPCSSMRSNQFCILMIADGTDINSAVNGPLLLKDLVVHQCGMGIHLKGWKNVNIDNIELYNNGMIETFYHNIYLRRDFNVTIKNMKSHDSPTGNGINISQSSYIYAFLSLFENNYWRGLRIEGEDGYICQHFLVYNNTANGNKDAGFRFANDDNGIVEYNYAKDNKENCYKGSLHNVVFIDNEWILDHFKSLMIKMSKF